LPSLTLAADCPACPIQAEKGFVPCGNSCYVESPSECDPCKLCHFFIMVDRVLDFIVMKMVPAIATLMLVIGGAMFFFAGGSPTSISSAKKVITSTIIGLVIIFSAFLVVGTILSAIGLTDWTQDIYRNWWQEGFFQIPGC